LKKSIKHLIGVTLIKIAKGEKLVSIAKIAETEDESGIPEEEAE
jgi:hypothetical protein